MKTPIVERDGDDLIVNNVRCTCFGGAHDPQDNGDTASGVNTKKDPDVIGVALPRRYNGRNAALRAALGDGIIPSTIPFFLPVEITDLATGKTESGSFIDIGPNERTDNFIDATEALARKFKPDANSRNFEIMCNYRIIGGAKFLLAMLACVLTLCLGGCITKTEISHNGQVAIATRGDVTNMDYVWSDGTKFHVDKIDHSTATLAGGTAVAKATSAVGSGLAVSGIAKMFAH